METSNNNLRVKIEPGTNICTECLKYAEIGTVIELIQPQETNASAHDLPFCDNCFKFQGVLIYTVQDSSRYNIADFSCWKVKCRVPSDYGSAYKRVSLSRKCPKCGLTALEAKTKNESRTGVWFSKPVEDHPLKTDLQRL